jgi:molybdopterin molybdotransferase
LTVEAALASILGRVRVLGTEQVDLLGSPGRVLAEPVVSRREIPPWANSSMDGYALRSTDTAAAGTHLVVVGTVVAGTVTGRQVGQGEAMRIFTGAPLPAGTDAVVPQEDVETEGDRIKVRSLVGAGACVRLAGEDIRRGDLVLQAGEVIGAAEIGLLATLGHTSVLVHRRPRVAILSTGSELADLGTEPGPGQIPNINTYTLMAQVLEAGADPVNLGVVPDRLDAIEERVGWGTSADIFLSSAGVSVGDLDLVRDALVRSGAELHLWRVAMRPGKPITFGSLRGRPVFGLPGNPVSAMVTFELFVRPALLRMAGRARLDRPRITARALEPISNPGIRRGYLRVVVQRDGAGFGVRLTGEQGSAMLRSMVLADGLAVIPGDTVVGRDDPVEVILLRPLEVSRAA